MLTGLPGDDVQRPSPQMIDTFYEVHKNWLIGPVIMDYNSILNPPLLEFYTYSQPVRGGKYSVEFYGKERYISKTMTSVEVNINKNITNLKITLTDEQETVQLATIRNNDVYPAVKRVIIHSQMTITPMENDEKSR